MMEEPQATDRSGVVAPPPLFFLAALGAGLALGRGDDAGVATRDRRGALGLAAIAGGLALGVASVRRMGARATKVNPYAPSTALVDDGPFAVSRNPIYVAMTSLYIGIALRANSVPALVLLPVALALLDRGVVDREERYLERTFGDAYRAYRARVPRWF